MIGKRRRERRRQAYAAIERYEQQLRAAKYVGEGWEKSAIEAQARETAANADREQALKKLADANAELRRWGLEPITRDEAASPEHPQRYRRHSDWRTTRSGAELTELLERSVTCSPPGVDVSIGYESDAPVIVGQEDAADPDWSVCPTCSQVVKAPAGSYECGREVGGLEAPIDDRLAALRRMRDDALAECDAFKRELGDVLTACNEAERERDAARAALADLSALTGSVSGERALGALLESCRAEYRDVDASRKEALARVAELEAELEAPSAGWTHPDVLAEERTLREQAERSRDRAQALNLDLQRWRERERDALASFVSALADAAAADSLHHVLRAPFERAAALLEDPEG